MVLSSVPILVAWLCVVLQLDYTRSCLLGVLISALLQQQSGIQVMSKEAIQFSYIVDIGADKHNGSIISCPEAMG